ncbi:MAG: helix-turn-helix domain-containing protein, partial [Acidimicrobiia bacterium]|nr:helix-turn-helix domain-containing protein [Acidimicrobiia bacterium]
MIDGELGAFLRNRREAVTPAEVGLPAGQRRRTTGLRRAEVATLAGVSVDYLIRIEQGRDTHPSAQVLAALADALRLSEDDRDHLRQLAVISNGTELCPQAIAAARTVRPTVRALLARLEPAPAFVLNHLGDLLAWTDGYERLARPVGILDGDGPNLLWFTFTDKRARTAYPD